MDEILLDIRNWNEWVKDRFPNKDFITLEDLLEDHQDLISEVDHLKEQINDLEQDIEDNYKPVSKAEQYIDNEII